MANRMDIRQVSLSNNKYTSLIKGLHNAISLDFHYKKSLLFWSDVSTDVIKMSFMNGTGVRNVIKWGLESPGGVCVDWIHDLIFFTDSGTRRVEVATFDGSLRAVIAANELDKPRAVAVHPGEALIFWTDWGKCCTLRALQNCQKLFSLPCVRSRSMNNRKWHFNIYRTESENRMRLHGWLGSSNDYCGWGFLAEWFDNRLCCRAIILGRCKASRHRKRQSGRKWSEEGETLRFREETQ